MIVTVGELFYESVLSTKILVLGGNKKKYPVGVGASHGSLQIPCTWLADLLESLEGLEVVDTVWKLFIL